MVSESIVAMMVEYRKKQGWSQFAFAKRLGVSERTIRRYEAGVEIPTMDVVERFARRQADWEKRGGDDGGKHGGKRRESEEAEVSR